jgi:hypothetical protein
MLISLCFYPNWVTQSLPRPPFISPFACGTASNFSICDQLIPNCKHFPLNQRSVHSFYHESICRKKKETRGKTVYYCCRFSFALYAWWRQKGKLFLNGCEVERNKNENLWENILTYNANVSLSWCINKLIFFQSCYSSLYNVSNGFRFKYSAKVCLSFSQQSGSQALAHLTDVTAYVYIYISTNVTGKKT